MISIWLHIVWTTIRNHMTLLYIFLACLCLWALNVQMSYRIPGRFLFLVLPWIGVALSALSLVLLLGHLLKRAPAEDPFRQVFHRIEQWATLLICAFIFYSILLYVNGKWDNSQPTDKTTEILEISGGEINLGWLIPYSWAELRSWEHPDRAERLFLLGEEQRKLWPGQHVVVQVRQGYLGLPWVSKIERDDEKHYLEILQLVPTAAEAWKDLIYFYLDRRRWKEAFRTTQDYLKIYPNDYEFASSVASSFAISRLYVEAVAILEPFVTRRPSYEVYNLVGFDLAKTGNYTRAVELLKASIPLDPDNWVAYYHLGYVLRDMSKPEEAVVMFEKVLERRPNIPEVKEQIRILRQKIAPQRSSDQPK